MGDLTSDLLDVVRRQLASTDHPVNNYETEFVKAILEAINRNASDGPPYASHNWDVQGYASPAEEIDDMANVGRSLIERIASVRSSPGPFEKWTPMDDPAEIVTDMANWIDEHPTHLTNDKATS